MKQFDNLPPCPLERAQRYGSGRRDCMRLDMPCGRPDLCKQAAEAAT